MDDNNLPIVNAIDELKASNKDQRERLQKSMRAGLLNVKKSVDALSFSFERSLIDQSLAQERMHEATMAFHEASLEQGKHSGHLFAAKMTAVGAGLVAWFESKLLKELKEINTGNIKGSEGHKNHLGELKEIRKLVDNFFTGSGKGKGGIPYLDHKLDTIMEALGVKDEHGKKHSYIVSGSGDSSKDGVERNTKALVEPMETMSETIKRLWELFKTQYKLSREKRIEEERKKKNEPKNYFGDLKNFFKKTFKPKENWFTSLLKGLGILGAGVLVFDNWEGIKKGLISVKDFLHDTYKHVSENSELYKGIATVMGSIWLLSKAWLVSVAVIQGTTMAIKTSFIAISNAFRLIKRAFLPLTVLFAGWEAYNKAMEEYEKSGDWEKAAGVFGAEFIKQVVVGPLTLLKDIGSWMAEKLGFKEVSKWLDEIDVGKEYDKLKETVDGAVYGAFNWIGDKIKAGWTFITETAPEWIMKKHEELTQVFKGLYDDAIKWIKETFSWDNLKKSLGFGDESVMTDPNVKPSEELTKSFKQAIEDKKAADKLSQIFKNRLEGVSSTNTPSGNGAGETMMIKGTTSDGQSITAPIVTNAPTSINNQNNTTNNSTIMQPLSTNPSAGFNWTDTNNRLFDIP